MSRALAKLRATLAQRKNDLETLILGGQLEHDVYLRLCGERRALVAADREIEDLVAAARREEEEDN